MKVKIMVFLIFIFTSRVWFYFRKRSVISEIRSYLSNNKFLSRIINPEKTSIYIAGMKIIKGPLRGSICKNKFWTDSLQKNHLYEFQQSPRDSVLGEIWIVSRERVSSYILKFWINSKMKKDDGEFER